MNGEQIKNSIKKFYQATVPPALQGHGPQKRTRLMKQRFPSSPAGHVLLSIGTSIRGPTASAREAVHPRLPPFPAFPARTTLASAGICNMCACRRTLDSSNLPRQQNITFCIHASFAANILCPIFPLTNLQYSILPRSFHISSKYLTLFCRFPSFFEPHFSFPTFFSSILDLHNFFDILVLLEVIHIIHIVFNSDFSPIFHNFSLYFPFYSNPAIHTSNTHKISNIFYIIFSFLFFLCFAPSFPTGYPHF